MLVDAQMLGQLAAGEHGAEGDDVIHRARVCSAADHRRLGAVAGLLTVDRKKLPDNVAVFIHIYRRRILR